MKYIASLFIALGLTLFAAPAEAHRPIVKTETKCINKSCTVVKQRTCRWTVGYNTIPMTRIYTCSKWQTIHYK